MAFSKVDIMRSKMFLPKTHFMKKSKKKGEAGRGMEKSEVSIKCMSHTLLLDEQENRSIFGEILTVS